MEGNFVGHCLDKVQLYMLQLDHRDRGDTVQWPMSKVVLPAQGKGIGYFGLWVMKPRGSYQDKQILVLDWD